MVFAQPITMEGQSIGSFKLGVSTASIASALTKLYMLLAISTFGLTATMVIILTWLFTHKISKPLRKITGFAQIIAAGELRQHANGDYDGRLQVEGHDEVAVLSEALNHMADKISAAQVELEQRVWERTRQLEESQRALMDAKEVAEAANRAKSEFLANMSHERPVPSPAAQRPAGSRQMGGGPDALRVPLCRAARITRHSGR